MDHLAFKMMLRASLFLQHTSSKLDLTNIVYIVASIFTNEGNQITGDALKDHVLSPIS